MFVAHLFFIQCSMLKSLLGMESAIFLPIVVKYLLNSVEIWSGFVSIFPFILKESHRLDLSFSLLHNLFNMFFKYLSCMY